MDAPRVYSHLPEELRGIVGYALGEIEHVALDGDHVAAARTAAGDPLCVAFLGPLPSRQVAETAAILNEARIPQLAVGATYAALTRDEPGADDGMPASLSPRGQRTLFRLVPRDTAIARAVVARFPRASLICDGTGYGEQIAAQLRMVGLREGGGPITLYAGLAEAPPDLPDGPLLAFEGAAADGFPAHARFAMPQRGGEGWSARDAIRYGPQAKEAAMLVYGSAMAGGPTRAGVLLGLRSCGRFDAFGDTVERRIGVWRSKQGALVPVGDLEDPGE